MNSEKLKNYSINSLNQYTAVNSNAYTYDEDGNLRFDGTRTFTWDKKNRLTSVVMGTTTVTYVYDHNDLRVKKTVSVQGSTVKVVRYIYDGSLLLAEYEDDVLVKVYINDGEGVVGMVRYLYNEGAFSHYQRLYYLYDTLGSVAQVTAENGLALQEYLYTPYGEAYNTEYDSVNGLRFVGRYGGYTDDEINLILFGVRWFDFKTGGFISRDKLNNGMVDLKSTIEIVRAFSNNVIGSCVLTSGCQSRNSKNANVLMVFLSLNPDFTNLYSYAGENPLRYIDPSGLWYIDISFSTLVGFGIGGIGGIQFGSNGLSVYGGGTAGLNVGLPVSITWSPNDISDGFQLAASVGIIIGAQSGIGFNCGVERFDEFGLTWITASLSVYRVFKLFNW